ncbi:MAG TPA: hypothetical protein VFH30_11935 [Acidimicrobiales bacterium]|nr:hypothetical protein [Acidimicrobiales bacterium]
MGMPGNARLGRLREHGARALLMLAVAVVVAIVAVGLVAADVDRVEVVATLLFVPVFAAGLVVGRSAGLLAAAAATIVYLALRSADVDAAGVSSVGLLAVTRAAAYAVAAEVGLRAQPLADRLSQGNEWDDSPLVARGRAFSKRDRPGDDAFAAGQPTSVWVARPADDPDYAGSTYADSPAWSEPAPVPAEVGATGSEWADPLGSLGSDPGWPSEPPARPLASSGWPPDPPTVSPPPWSDPYGSRAVRGEADPSDWAPPAPSPAPWSDPGGTPAVADPDGARGQPGAWYDAVPPPVRPASPPRHAAPAAPSAPTPPIDPETRLWTARFLCDRIAAEKAYCERTGSPFSLVLVQVPDEPFALLPYRRQVTLLRELGHQFVAGGVIDHLVHVPDQTQHWFAVVLPDIDRAGAQVLERRLRMGIGGYLRSRGLPLPELESASLTSPDDDRALGAIWDALAVRGDPAGAGSSSGVLAY